MKIFKGIISLILCFVVLISMVSFTAFAEGGAVTVKSAQDFFKPFSRSAVKGDTFDVIIRLQSDIKVVDGTVKLSYDKNYLNVTACDGIGSISNLNSSPAISVFTAGEGFYDFTAEDELLTYSFEVIETPVGNQSIEIDFDNLTANKTSINDEGEEDLTVNGDVKFVSKGKVLSDDFSVNALYGTLKGDVNLDGVVNINDVTELQLALVEKKTLSDEQTVLANIYIDGIINIRDTTMIQLFLAEFVEFL